MEKRTFINKLIIALAITICIVGCTKKAEKESDLNLLHSLINKTKPIKDSLTKVSKNRNIKLLVCKLEEDGTFYKISIVNKATPYFVKNAFEIKKVNNAYVLYESKNKLGQLNTDFLTQKLIAKHYITFANTNNLFLEEPYLNFIICKKNRSNIGVFDNIMVAKLQLKYMKVGKTYNETLFYPRCE